MAHTCMHKHKHTHTHKSHIHTHAHKIEVNNHTHTHTHTNTHTRLHTHTTHTHIRSTHLLCYPKTPQESDLRSHQRWCPAFFGHLLLLLARCCLTCDCLMQAWQLNHTKNTWQRLRAWLLNHSKKYLATPASMATEHKKYLAMHASVATELHNIIGNVCDAK